MHPRAGQKAQQEDLVDVVALLSDLLDRLTEGDAR